MPNFKQHRDINLKIFSGLLILAVIKNFNYLFLVGYIFSTYFMNPDLDQDQSRADKSLGYLWDKYWDFYNKLFRHRGISHSFIFGTLTRVLYLSVICIPFISIAFLTSYHYQLLSFIAGIYTADNIHLIADTIQDIQKQ